MSERWGEIKRIFAKASALRGKAREAYLTRARLSADIRLEVESLLAEHDRPGSFLGLLSTLDHKRLAHYDIGERLGEGGMSLVYRARDTRLKRWVALKVLQFWAMADSQAIQRLMQEAKSAAQLNHPNIVTIHEVVEQNGVCAIAMELISGKTLSHTIPPGGLSVDRSLRYGRDIAQAMAFAHRSGILHGDLTPANIMVTDDDQIKVLDFGLAKTAQRRPSARPSAAARNRCGYGGTAIYMAPEQLGAPRRGPTVRSEVFAFGLLLHQMLTGAHAFVGNSRPQIVDSIRHKPPGALPESVPAEVASLVGRCLEKHPKRRFAGFEQVLKELGSLSFVSEGAQARPEAQVPGIAVNTIHRVDPVPSLEDLKHSLEKLSYQNVAQSRAILTDATRRLSQFDSSALRDLLNPVLRAVIMTATSDDRIAGHVRQLRTLTFDLIRQINGAELDQCFTSDDLEHLDLYGFNFAEAHLARRSFESCFLVESDLSSSDLTAASFQAAWIRNVNFANANLTEADLTDADWFNALGLTEAQLRTARGVMECPRDVATMRQVLRARYPVPFEAWSSKVQQELLTTWDVYLRPDGLADYVRQRRESR